MTLLAPFALAFASLLAVPVIVHLFKPRRVRQTPFSSLRWLALSPQKLSRRIRPHQLLLFAMRGGFVLLLALALARPLWSNGDAPLPGDRVIVLDVSRSMAVRSPGRISPIERARVIAAGLVESAPPGTRTTVLLVSTTARRLGSPDRDASALVPELRQVEATAADTNLAAALPPAKPLLSGSGRPGELIFVTDNQQGAWDTDAITAFATGVPPGVRVRVIDVGQGAVPNGWIASARVVEVGDPVRRLLRIELAASIEGQDRMLRVSGIPGEPESARAVAIEPGRPTVLHLELPGDADLRGKIARVSLEPPDALPDDDEFFVSLDPRSALRVLLISPETGSDATRPGFPLRIAMKALTDTGARTVRVTPRSPAVVSAADVNANDVLMLADVPDLPESVVTALNERVRFGAGLAVFLGPRAKPDWYNQNFARPLQPAEGLLPVSFGPVVTAPERVPWVVPVRPHALFAGLSDPSVGDLADVSATRYRRLDGQLPEGVAVIARVPDGTPLVIEHRVGAGTVLLVNASPDSSFSDLHASKIFIPFVDRMLGSLGKGRGQAFTVGQPGAFPLEGVRPGDALALIGPGEKRRMVKVRGEAGRAVLELESLEIPGSYRVEAVGIDPFAFAVNAGRGDSALSPQDPAVLKTWWKPLDCTVETAAPDSEAAKPAHGPIPLWPAPIVLAAVVLGVETLTAAWLCPRLPPPATTSLIQKQRLQTAGGSP